MNNELGERPHLQEHERVQKMLERGWGEHGVLHSVDVNTPRYEIPESKKTEFSFEVNSVLGWTENFSVALFEKSFEDLNGSQKKLVLNVWLMIAERGISLERNQTGSNWTFDFSQNPPTFKFESRKGQIDGELQGNLTWEQREQILAETREVLGVFATTPELQQDPISRPAPFGPTVSEVYSSGGSLYALLSSIGARDLIDFSDRKTFLTSDTAIARDHRAGINQYLQQMYDQATYEKNKINPSTGAGYRGTAEQNNAWSAYIRETLKKDDPSMGVRRDSLSQGPLPPVLVEPPTEELPPDLEKPAMSEADMEQIKEDYLSQIEKAFKNALGEAFETSLKGRDLTDFVNIAFTKNEANYHLPENGRFWVFDTTVICEITNKTTGETINFTNERQLSLGQTRVVSNNDVVDWVTDSMQRYFDGGSKDGRLNKKFIKRAIKDGLKAERKETRQTGRDLAQYGPLVEGPSPDVDPEEDLAPAEEGEDKSEIAVEEPPEPRSVGEIPIEAEGEPPVIAEPPAPEAAATLPASPEPQLEGRYLTAEQVEALPKTAVGPKTAQEAISEGFASEVAPGVIMPKEGYIWAPNNNPSANEYYFMVEDSRAIDYRLGVEGYNYFIGTANGYLRGADQSLNEGSLESAGSLLSMARESLSRAREYTFHDPRFPFILGDKETDKLVQADQKLRELIEKKNTIEFQAVKTEYENEATSGQIIAARFRRKLGLPEGVILSAQKLEANLLNPSDKVVSYSGTFTLYYEDKSVTFSDSGEINRGQPLGAISLAENTGEHLAESVQNEESLKDVYRFVQRIQRRTS